MELKGMFSSKLIKLCCHGKKNKQKIPAIQLAKVCPENIYIVKCNQTNTYQYLCSVIIIKLLNVIKQTHTNVYFQYFTQYVNSFDK